MGSKIGIPRVVRPIRLEDFAEEYAGNVIWMWVNPPRGDKNRYSEIGAGFDRVRKKITRLVEEIEAATPEDEELPEDDERIKSLAGAFGELEELGQELYAWLSDKWSQHEDPETHWTVEEINEFAIEALNRDPGLWDFVQEETIDIMKRYREGKKKN